MGKRLTDTEIWDQDWFIDLPNKYKLLWNYIKDKCDNVGIWRPNVAILQKILGEPLCLREFISFVNIDKERLKELPSGRWWLKDFFVFQYGNSFSPTSPVHKGALKQLVANGIHPNEIFNLDSGFLQNADFKQVKEIAYEKDINKIKEAFGIPINRDIYKDKDINKNKDKYKGGTGEKIKAVNILDGFAIFEDGSTQPLGQSQKARLSLNDLKPKDIQKGLIC